LIAAVIVLAWLFRVAVNRGPRGQGALASALALALALTVVQPFGVVAERVSSAPPDGQQVDPTGDNSLGALRFHIYGQDISQILVDDTREAILKAQSSVAGVLLYNTTDVASICKGLGDPPCWEVDGSGMSLRSMIREGDNYWLTLSYDPDVVKERGFDVPPSELAYTWKLSLGVASFGGALYWLLGTILMGSVIWRMRKSLSASGSDEAHSGVT
jgi:hypothetical protein